jgi:hypothetical protein
MSGIFLLDIASQQHLRTWHTRISPTAWNDNELNADFISRFSKAIETETRVDMVQIEANAILDDWRLEYAHKNSLSAKFVDSTVKNNSLLELPSIPAVSTDAKKQEFDGGTGVQSGPDEQAGLRIVI